MEYINPAPGKYTLLSSTTPLTHTHTHTLWNHMEVILGEWRIPANKMWTFRKMMMNFMKRLHSRDMWYMRCTTFYAAFNLIRHEFMRIVYVCGWNRWNKNKNWRAISIRFIHSYQEMESIFFSSFWCVCADIQDQMVDTWYVAKNHNHLMVT